MIVSPYAHPVAEELDRPHGWHENGVDLDALERFRISIGGGCLADLCEAEARAADADPLDYVPATWNGVEVSA